METVPKDPWYFMVLLIFLSILKVSFQQRDGATTVKLAEGMVLGCVCPWDGNLSMVSWTKLIHFEKAPVAVLHPEYGVHISSAYQTRIKFLKSTPMDGSITVRKVTPDDTGLYRCSVQTFPHGSWTTDVRVDMHKETAVDSVTEDDEDVPASETELIKADTELIVQRSDNLTITCNCPHNVTIYQVTLEKLDRSSTSGMALMAMCQLKDGRLLEVNYTARGRVSCSERLDTSLHLENVVEDDRGLYQCRINTDTGEQITTVLLTVLRQVEISLSVYVIYVAGGTAGLLVLLSAIITLVRCQRKNRREESRIKFHTAQRRLCNEYENVPVYDKMRKATNWREDRPVYANINTVPHHTRRKR
ncbi:hypothetical protein UPYG_G00075010 [Umbra pygmaea]|uniref:Ig-like domain-containing protein n=1 Tax=Umbra pygmaea TaxID=75934 RepID=A0ABD0XX73_UMBPY